MSQETLCEAAKMLSSPRRLIMLGINGCLSVFLLASSSGSLTLARAQEAKPTAPNPYPLRLHILAIDDTHRTVRMQPNWSAGTVPDVTGEGIAPTSSGSGTLGGGDDDFSGAGRADLVTLPDTTSGLTFTYEGCPRVRVPPGFTGLEARWKKPGSRLEVKIPTDSLTNGKTPVGRCTLKVVPQELIYLRMTNGKIVRVSPEAYNKKPSLRMFLSGGSETLKRRSAKPSEPATPGK